MAKNTRFLEIERKYRANSEDWSEFVTLLKGLGPSKRLLVEGPDTYYENGDRVLRWRHSKDKPELTIKAKTSATSNLVREEVDYPAKGDARTTMTFVRALGYKKAFRIRKKCQIFWYERKEGNVNVVIYDVTCRGHRTRRFVEIEAEKGMDLELSKRLVDEWEKKLGLSPRQRESRSLYEIYSGKPAPTTGEADGQAKD